ncbi:hypothetical protein [Aliarcobacter butzleri]|uniref:hypothetical protein n=1 Tax=Aliarcobacter butzleri TaxID=28197 RepID=UPI00125F370B|nr:hypothetical protein [Aliarcobacter butzleri]MCT7594367.1 hypothetical protein [Aliarcobacter butzleri]MCT7598990.1 hypothetical protein [Aliarcobacter butzleri]MCT7652686.1 hypothetical protein [Aliarcobacter butzleri]MDN5049454.1 hypothetical protein [Aliarcobacter butzleri]MDN5056351.1 hypothetical protein [Aliarcobacter butzleri]
MENKFDELSFFEKEYEHELIEKDAFETYSINFITLMVINITFLSYYLINAPLYDIFNFYSFSSYMFCSLLLIYISILILVILNFFRFYFSKKTYIKKPFINDLNKYFQELKEYDSKNYDLEVKNYLINMYSESATHNSQVNDYRKSIFFEIRGYLFLQFLVLFLLFIPFYNIKDGKLDTYNVEIIKGLVNVK